MKIEGEIKKGNKYWSVKVPLLLVNTQGKTKKDAFFMVKDAIELMIDKVGFEIDVFPGKDNYFSISSNNDAILIGFALKQQRANDNLSIRDVVAKMGKKSVTAYTRYENGTHKPNFEKLTEILKAINPVLEPALKIGFGQSAQVTDLYTKDELLGRQIVAVVNFPPKQIGPMRSEFLLCGFYQDDRSVVLAVPERQVKNGAKLG